MTSDVSTTASAQDWGQAQKILPRHRDRLAAIYVRQSTMQQVERHRESTQLQYGLQEHARRLGWPPERILVIDDDLGISGTSSVGRAGFQRLLAEVALDHVGLILGVEMSRLARSCRDWYQLLDLCAPFGTLIGDLDGLYDPAQYNDRLLLGLKGTMSEAELHILKQRMLQGKQHKARRGELGMAVPTGYVRRPSGEVILDPDEEVRAVVRSVFEQFERLGTVHAVLRLLTRQGTRLGIRVPGGLNAGELEWRRPNRWTLTNMVRNPIYAGAYVYGRRCTDPRRKKPGRRHTGQRVVAPGDWQVCLKDRLPAYISWEQFEHNLAQLAANRTGLQSSGSIRQGPALLQGLVVCGRCGARMYVQYSGSKPRTAYYACNREQNVHAAALCQILAARPLDREVSRLALTALAPAALEVSLKVSEDLEQQRAELERQWRCRLERARYEAERAARQYHAVEPENRLVARTLEATWEEKLRVERELTEDYERSRRERPRVLTEEERAVIRDLAEDLPALWHAPTTTDADRKAVLRQILDQVEVKVEGKTEWVEAMLHWAGGRQTYTRLRRPVARLDQTSTYRELCERVTALKTGGLNAPEIAARLNAEGWRPARATEFTAIGVRQLLMRLGLSSGRHPRAGDRSDLGPHEWWIRDLAQELKLPPAKLRHWHKSGWLRVRQLGGKHGRLVVWADEAEQERLRAMGRQRRLRNPGPPGSSTSESGGKQLKL